MSNKPTQPAVMVHGNFHPSFFALLKERKVKSAFVLEGRPGLEGAKVLCAQLLKDRIKPVLIADNMAGFCFSKGYVKEVWVTYQEDKGDSLFCSVGSLILSILAKRHHAAVKAFPAAKKSAILAPQKSIFSFAGKRVAAKGVKGFVPLLEDVPKTYLTEVYL